MAETSRRRRALNPIAILVALLALGATGVAWIGAGRAWTLLLHVSRDEIEECESVRRALAGHGSLEERIAAVASAVPLARVVRLHDGFVAGSETVDLDFSRFGWAGFDELADRAFSWSYVWKHADPDNPRRTRVIEVVLARR